MMAATSICSSKGAKTAKGPRLQEARCSTEPDQEMHMEDPSMGHTGMVRQGRPIEVLIHDRRGRSARCQENRRYVIHTPEAWQNVLPSGQSKNKAPLPAFVAPARVRKMRLGAVPTS